MEAESWNGSDPCEIARASASAALDGEGAPDPHVEGCAACREYVAALASASARFAALREGAATDLWPAIAARIKTARRARRRPVPLLRLAAAGVGFAATTLALRAVGERAAEPRADGSIAWAAALHPAVADEEVLTTAPERQLLAALERGAEERR